MKLYDKANNRLIHLQQKATPDHWDLQWTSGDFEKQLCRENGLIKKITKKYLPVGARVLEGGCGRGQHVLALTKEKFDVYGVDFAVETIKMIKRIEPKLRVSVGDVRKLDFENDFFDGYWSLGVIEHFEEGYDSILKEMYRVLKPKGYLFLTVPSMSLLRKIKAFLNLYEVGILDKSNSEKFYQYILDQKNVIKSFENNKFKLISSLKQSGLYGLKEEIPVFRPVLDYIYKNPKRYFKFIRTVINIGINIFSNHSTLFVFIKQ